MELMDKIIERVKLLLGDTYYIRYQYNMVEECITIRAMRRDCDIEFYMNLHKEDLDIEMHIMSSFIAQRIISGFSDIIENYDKYKKGDK